MVKLKSSEFFREFDQDLYTLLRSMLLPETEVKSSKAFIYSVNITILYIVYI